MGKIFIVFLIYPIVMGVIMYEYRKELWFLLKTKVLNVQDTKYDLLVGVLSQASHFKQRETIRDTWGSISKIDDSGIGIGFVLGKQMCPIHPEDRIDALSCQSWEPVTPQVSNGLCLVSTVSEVQPEEGYTNNYGVQTIHFKVLHDIVLTHLGVHHRSAVNDVQVQLKEAQSHIDIVGVEFSAGKSSAAEGEFIYRPVAPYILPKGFEGLLIAWRTDADTDVLSRPSTRVVTRLNLGGGVIHILPHEEQSRSGSRAWNRPHVTLVSFKFDIHDVESLQNHINASESRHRQWMVQMWKQTLRLIEEQEKHGDLVVVDTVDVFRNHPEKLLLFLKWAKKEVDFRFVLKSDDDTFVDLARVVEVSAGWHNISHLWWGRFRRDISVERAGVWAEHKYSAPVYPQFACRSGYVLGRDAAHWLADNAHRLHKYQREDISMGIWMSAIDSTYMDDPLWMCEGQCVSDMRAVPDLNPEQVREMWLNKNECGDICGCS